MAAAEAEAAAAAAATFDPSALRSLPAAPPPAAKEPFDGSVIIGGDIIPGGSGRIDTPPTTARRVRRRRSSEPRPRRNGRVIVGVFAALVMIAGFAVLGSQLISEQRNSERLSTSLGAANEKIGALEDRLAAVANEKAQAEDEREIERERAAVLGQLAVLASSVADGMERCVDAVFEIAKDAVGGYDVSYSIRAAMPGCRQAYADYGVLQRIIDDLVA